MKNRIVLTAMAVGLCCAGCFKHREAPPRPVTASSLEEAAQKRAEIECLNLAGQEISALPRELAAMPKLSVLWLRGAKGLTGFGVLSDLKALKRLTLGLEQSVR